MSISIVLIIIVAIAVSFVSGAFVGYVMKTSETKEQQE